MFAYLGRDGPEGFDDYVLHPTDLERDDLVRFSQLQPASLAKAFEYTNQKKDLPSDINVMVCAAANRAIKRHYIENFEGRRLPNIIYDVTYTVVKSISMEESAVIYEGSGVSCLSAKKRTHWTYPTEVTVLRRHWDILWTSPTKPTVVQRQRDTLCCSSNPGPGYPSTTFVPDIIYRNIVNHVAYPLPWGPKRCISSDSIVDDILEATCVGEDGYWSEDVQDLEERDELKRVTLLNQAAFLPRIERGDEPEASQFAKNCFDVNKAGIPMVMPSLYEPLAGAQAGDATHFAPVFATAPAIAQFYKRVSAMEGGVNEANCRTLVKQIEAATAMPELDGKCYVFCAIRSKTGCGWIDPRWSLEVRDDVEFVLNTLNALQNDTKHARAVRKQVDSIARISMIQEPITLDQPVRVIAVKPVCRPLVKNVGESSPSFLRVDIPRQVRSHPLHRYIRAIIVDPQAVRVIHAAVASSHANALLGSFSGDDYRFTQIRRAMEPLVQDFLASETKKRGRDDMEKKAEERDKVNGGPRPAKIRKSPVDFS